MGEPLVRVYEQGADETDRAFAERVSADYAKAVETTPYSIDDSDLEAY